MGQVEGKKINLEDKELSEAFVMPPRVANEPYLLSLQYKVINSILNRFTF